MSTSEDCCEREDHRAQGAIGHTVAKQRAAAETTVLVAPLTGKVTEVTEAENTPKHQALQTCAHLHQPGQQVPKLSISKDCSRQQQALDEDNGALQW
eukprot:969160-Amphidinium_carterae.1